MNLAGIKAYCIVVKMGSISKAARKLKISQPALSLQMQALEKYFDGTLLERTNKGVKPTKLGQVVYNYSKKVASIINNLNKEIEQSKVVAPEQLSVAVASTLGCYVLPRFLSQFKKSYKNLNQLRIVTDNTNNVIENILEGGSDLGVVEGSLERDYFKEEGLTITNIYLDEIVLVGAKGGEWDDLEEINLDNLKALPLILRENGSGIRRSMEENLNDKGVNIVKLNIVMELNNIAAVKSSVEALQGLSFLPRLAVNQDLIQNRLKIIKIRDTYIPHPYSFICFPDKLCGKLMCDFREFVTTRIKELCSNVSLINDLSFSGIVPAGSQKNFGFDGENRNNKKKISS